MALHKSFIHSSAIYQKLRPTGICRGGLNGGSSDVDGWLNLNGRLDSGGGMLSSSSPAFFGILVESRRGLKLSGTVFFGRTSETYNI